MDAPICDHTTYITAEATTEGTKVHIKSGCKSVQHYGHLLKEVDMDDINELEGSKIMDLAVKAGLTPTCLVPVAVYNVCWMEQGMISKTLALSKKQIAIEFLE